MSTPKLLKFDFLNESGEYYYVDSDGEVQTTATVTSIKDTPDGWDKTKYKLGRHDTYLGINLSLTTPYRFWGDAKIILKHIYYKDGKINFDAYCKVVIRRRKDNDPSDVWGYETFGNAYTVDFSNDNEEEPIEEGGFFNVRLIEENVFEQIEANADTEYDIEVGDDGIGMILEGKKLEAEYNWLASDLDPVNVVSATEYYIVPMGLIKEDVDYFRNYIYAQNQGVQVLGLSIAANDSTRLLANDIPFINVDYTIEAEIVVDNVGGASDLQLRIDILQKPFSGSAGAFSTIFSSSIGLVGSTVINVSQSGTHTFDPNFFSHYLTIRTPATSVQNVNISVNSISFKINNALALPPNTISTLRYNKFAEKVLSQASLNTATLATGFLGVYDDWSNLSQYFNNLPFYTYVCSGNGVRGIADSKIKTTFKNLFQDARSRWALGMDVTGSVVDFKLHKDLFKKDTLIADVGEVSNLKRRTATDFLVNKVTCGYEDQTLDKLNAKYEANSEHQYSLRLKRIKTELDIKSSYRADVYGIEYTRGDLIGKNTTDNKADDDVFLLEGSDEFVGVDNTLKRYSSPDTVTGVFSGDTHYNIGLQPERFIYRWGSYFKGIRSTPDGTATADCVYFVSAKKNQSLETFIDGWVITEGADINVTDNSKPPQGDRLFSCVIDDFECKITENVLNAILADKYGVIGYTSEGVYYEGFILDAELTVENEGICNFTLLGSPKNTYSS